MLEGFSSHHLTLGKLRPMQMQRQACMRKACVLGLLLAVAACTDAAEAVQPQGTWRHLQQAADGQPAARRLLQAPACPGPLCAGPAGQTGPPQNAGLGGPSGPGAGGGAVSRAAPVMTPTNALPAAQSSPAASAGGVASPALSPDAVALRFFQQGLTNWRELKSWGFKGWDFTSNPCQGWSGVSCDATGRVSKLDLAGWGIKGRLAPELSGLDHLQTLTLENNELTGGLSSTWAASGVFQNLVEIDLSQNWNLSGMLLSQWGVPGALPLLQKLNLSNTGLGAELPALWGVNGSLPSLTSLDVSRNLVSGSLPMAWAVPGALASLETLVVSANNLSGPLPPEWGSSPGAFPALKTLDVRQNGLEGYLPDAWGVGFPNVTNLDLEQNIFVGQLPMDWAAAGRFPSLASLQLWNNSLTGAIPATWTNATALPALTSLAIKPGNVGLCGVVSGRILRVAGLSSGDLGNCTGLPPPRRVFPWTALAPAPAPSALLSRLPGGIPAALGAPAPAPGALVTPVIAPQAVVAPQPAAAPAVVPNAAPVTITVAVPVPAPAAAVALRLPAAVAPAAAAIAPAPVPVVAPALAPTPVPTSPPLGAGQAAIASSSLSIGVPSPPPPATPAPTPVPTPSPTPMPTPAPTPRTLAPLTPSPGSPAPLFVPPSNSAGTTSYLQATYNLTGADLSPSNTTTQRHIVTALRKALGPDVNATLLSVTAAAQPAAAAASSPASPSALSLTPVDPNGSTAGAGRRLLAPGSTTDPMVAGVGNTDLPADSTSPPSSSGASTGGSPSDGGLGETSGSGGASPEDSGQTASWATGAAGSPPANAAAAPAGPAGAGADAAGAPGSPAPHRRAATVAAYFLITTVPNQISTIARNISTPQTANKFDQQLRLTGLPGTRSAFSGVSQIAPDGTLRAISVPVAPAPAPSDAPVPMLTPAAADSGFLTGSGTVSAASPSPSPSAASGSNTGAIAGGVVGGLAAIIVAALLGMYIMRRRRAQQRSAAGLAKSGDTAGSNMEAGRGGPGYAGPESADKADPDRVEAMIASMKADAARAVSQRHPTAKPGSAAGSKPGSGKKGAAPAAAAAAAAAGAGKAEDSAHERDDNSESTVSEDSLARLGGRQRSGSIEEIRHAPGDHRADPQAAADKQRYLDKGKGKMPERRRTDSASSLRSVLRGRDGQVLAEMGPSSSSEGGSGSTPGSAPESLSGSEGMPPAPIKTMSRMGPQRSTSTGEKFMREASGGRGQERTLQQQQQRPGLSGPHQSGPARAPLSPYSSGSRGQPSHRSRSGNILAHLAAELEKAEGSGGVDRLMASHGSQGSRGTYPGANPQRRRTSDPDFLTTLGYSNGREQSGRSLTPGEYAAVLAARDRQRSGPARGSGSRNSSSGREVSREDPGATLQGLARSLSGNGHSSQSQEQLLRTLEHRLGLRSPSGGASQPRGSSSRPRSNNLERVGSAGSDQRLYRGARSDGIDRTHSQGSNMSGLGGPMESVGEDQEMKGSDWASAMRILHDMEADQSRDRDRRRPREEPPMGSSCRRGGSSRRE